MNNVFADMLDVGVVVYLDNILIYSSNKATHHKQVKKVLHWLRKHGLYAKTSWETWHQRFGHLGNSSLQTLLDKKLVTSLDIDLRSPKYDCKACTEAKQHATSYSKAATMTVTNIGELTHTDLWGKYCHVSCRKVAGV